MPRIHWTAPILWVKSVVLVCAMSGCTSPNEYFGNNLKVGPNYCPPPAPVAEHWIDASDVRLRNDSDDLSQWWTAFKDPMLDSLIAEAYRQDLTLREAGFRVLQARAQRGIVVGELFPQQQTAFGSYTRSGPVSYTHLTLPTIYSV